MDRSNMTKIAKDVKRRGHLRRRVVTNGFTLGSLVAVALSAGANHSVAWAVVHGLLSWAYVFFYLIGPIDAPWRLGF
jgi:hypothetical protein